MLNTLTIYSPFTDDKLKKDICFGETLIFGCGHHEGDVEEGSSESEWTCHESTVSESSSHVSLAKEYPPSPIILEDSAVEDEEVEDFHFFFFPDCKKTTPPKNSRDSIIMVDGLPQVNVNVIKKKEVCTCEKDEKGQCECFVKIPCYCGAKVTAECTCHDQKDICICKPLEPSPVCRCATDAKVCTCYPGLVLPECTCDKVEKPCICCHRTFTCPTVVCECKGKPGSTPSSRTSFPSYGEGEYSSGNMEPENKIKEPCECQKPEPKQLCYCTKGQACICKTIECVCGVQPKCVCLPEGNESIQCKNELIENKSICSCDKPAACTCGRTISQCICFPVKVCKCGDPDNCKCYSVCDCKGVCICDTKPIITKACTCVDSSKVPVTDLICTCPKKEDNKIRKVRAGKHGYRWCHEVDPHHTYFDYAYDRYDKIEKKESVIEKVVIQGLHEDTTQEEVCPVHEIKAPKCEKKVRRPSLDCCSAVGGIYHLLFLKSLFYVSCDRYDMTKTLHVSNSDKF